MEPADLIRPGQAQRLAEARKASGRESGEPATFGELPAIALADIGVVVGVDWRSLLPR